MVSLIRSNGHFLECSMEDVVVKKGVRVTGLHVPDVGSNLAVAFQLWSWIFLEGSRSSKSLTNGTKKESKTSLVRDLKDKYHHGTFVARIM